MGHLNLHMILFPSMVWHLSTSSDSSTNKALWTQREPLQDSSFPVLAAIFLLLLIPHPLVQSAFDISKPNQNSVQAAILLYLTNFFDINTLHSQYKTLTI